MPTTHFADRLLSAIERLDAPCVVGLDPVLEYIPDDFVQRHGLSRGPEREAAAELIEAFCLHALEEIAGLVPAVKPQMAYFERFGAPGMVALERCIRAANEHGLLVLLDGKRGDIGSTSTAYAQAYLGPDASRGFEVDCLTLNPYLGQDSVEPFVRVALDHGKGLFVCVRTSNPGADITQLPRTADGRAVFEVVADMVREFDAPSVGASGYGSIGAVVGATQPEAARALRKRMPHTLFLVPGVGAQGGSLDAVRACFDEQGRGAIVNNARAVLFPERFGAGQGGGIRRAAQDFVETVRGALRS